MTNQRDSNRQIALRALSGAVRAGVTRPSELRYHVVRDFWSVIKRFGATNIPSVEVREIPCVQEALIEGYVDDRNRSVLAAICQGVGAHTFFEIGTNRGRTAFTVARNVPELQAYTLDLPDKEAIGTLAKDVNDSDLGFFTGSWDRGEAFGGTAEAERIKQLWGDSATFDFSPYYGLIDVVYIDGAHSYSYVRNDTEAALRMLSPKGVIAWDDYPAIPGIYRYLTELADGSEVQPFHILGTRLVVLSRVPLLQRLGPGGYGAVEVA